MFNTPPPKPPPVHSTVPRLAALHLTGGGAGALSPLVLATALDALLWNSDVCHAADLLFAGDVAEQQLEVCCLELGGGAGKRSYPGYIQPPPVFPKVI